VTSQPVTAPARHAGIAGRNTPVAHHFHPVDE
jgi:hypothetical protein